MEPWQKVSDALADARQEGQRWEEVTKALTDAKREGLSWERAWPKAMRSLSPEKMIGLPQELRDDLAAERDLMREVKPWFRAAYEDREVTVEEFERASEATERRLDAVLVAV